MQALTLTSLGLCPIYAYCQIRIVTGSVETQAIYNNQTPVVVIVVILYNDQTPVAVIAVVPF